MVENINIYLGTLQEITMTVDDDEGVPIEGLTLLMTFSDRLGFEVEVDTLEAVEDNGIYTFTFTPDYLYYLPQGVYEAKIECMNGSGEGASVVKTFYRQLDVLKNADD